MGVLGVAAALEFIRGFGQVFRAEALGDISAHRVQRFLGNTHAVGTDVGDDTLGAFALQIHAFIKLLHHLHSFLGGKVQLAARFLLQRRSGKGRRGSLFLFPVLDAVDGEPGVLHPLLRFHGFRFVVQLGLLAIQGA